MNKITQEQKIIELCKDGNFHCQQEFRNMHIYSPHKRRSEIEERGRYFFEERKCVHNVRGQKDYRMVEKPPKDIMEYRVGGVKVSEKKIW
jgi:hypothetical protein